MAVRLPASERRRQLLDTALEVFGAHGFHGASMNQVAEAAGVTKPVLYQHFRSKRALYRELLDDVADRLALAVVEATGEAGSPHRQVQLGLRTYFTFVHGNRAAFRLMFGSGTRRDPEFAEVVTRVEDMIAEAVADLIVVPGMARASRLLLGYAIVGMSEGTSRHWSENGFEPSPEELAELVAELAWAGLRGLRPET
ncbi:MAG: TetR/AcrR family transcriptional regulator [Actinobacteria bacterium]|nr:TetR/AcrR family transcriptional regulator [Actinomycetota bacterium]